MDTKALAMKAVENLFGDTSRSQEETLDALEDIRDRAQEFIDTIRDELRAK